MREIEDIIRRLRNITLEVKTFEDVAEFLGFSLVDNTFYEPNHFTLHLQTFPLD